jgi:hypothetical protein
MRAILRGGMGVVGSYQGDGRIEVGLKKLARYVAHLPVLTRLWSSEKSDGRPKPWG